VTFLEILLTAFGLSADAFAVSVGSSSSGLLKGGWQKFRMAFHFGFFQFIMPVAGWFLGKNIAKYVYSFDHWIAFILLSWIGIRMYIDSSKPHHERIVNDPSKGLTLLMLSIATSIDAFAIGITLAMVGVSIWYPSVIIGLVTAFVCMAGIRIGCRFSKNYACVAEKVGGIILLLIGLKILLSHIFPI